MRSNLTKEQKRQAEAAIFGVPEELMTPQQLSPEEIERMRAILEAHDQAAGSKGIQEFDLNKPPVKPYVHQDFPRIMYHHGKRTHRVAANEDEMQLAIEAGWKVEPYPPEGVEPAAPVDASAEVEEVNERLRRARKGK